jgi:hypothetical protein
MVAIAFTGRNVMIRRAATSDRVASRTLPSVEVRWAYGAHWFVSEDEDSRHGPVHGEIGGRVLLLRERRSLLKL